MVGHGQRPPSEGDDAPAEIRGAFGTILDGAPSGSRSLRRRLLTLLAVIGPGIIVMVGDNDAGGVSTYAQAGQNYGLSLLWTLPLIIPVLIVNQEMVVRLGAVTGVGYARLINERFGRFWARFSVTGLFILNFLTIATEFAGVTLSLGFFGVSRYLCVPIAALALIAMTASGSFRRWERFMFIFVFANFLVIPLVVFAHPALSPIVHGYTHPAVEGGVSSTAVLFIIAIVGTTVAPWQLFFQQSNIVDKRITPRWVNYERADTVLGSGVTVLAATLIIATTAFAFIGHASLFDHFKDGAAVSHGLDAVLGEPSGALFAIVLLNASIIGAAAVTLTTTYAVGDLFGLRSSLDRTFGEARQFYILFTLLVALAAGIVMIPRAPLGLFVLAVQAFAGVLLPSTTIFALLLCNDRQILGPWVNRPWSNVVAGLVITVLLGLSMILMVTTVFSQVSTGVLGVILAVAFGAGIVVGVQLARHSAGEAPSWRSPDEPTGGCPPPHCSSQCRSRRPAVTSSGGWSATSSCRSPCCWRSRSSSASGGTELRERPSATAILLGQQSRTSFGEAARRTKAADPTCRETLRVRTVHSGRRGGPKRLAIGLRRRVPKL